MRHQIVLIISKVYVRNKLKDRRNFFKNKFLYNTGIGDHKSHAHLSTK